MVILYPRIQARSNQKKLHCRKTKLKMTTKRNQTDQFWCCWGTAVRSSQVTWPQRIFISIEKQPLCARSEKPRKQHENLYFSIFLLFLGGGGVSERNHYISGMFARKLTKWVSWFFLGFMGHFDFISFSVHLKGMSIMFPLNKNVSKSYNLKCIK